MRTLDLERLETRVSLVAQAELASSRAMVLLLHQRVDAVEAVARRNEDEIRQQ